MALINTTNTIDNSIYLKAKLDKNMVGDNYYIENLQDKRNEDWEYRYNRVGIEEELHKQDEYTNEEPLYTPIEVVITNVKGDKGEDLGTDWAKISFKDLKHPNWVGSRYRFSLDFPDMTKMSEEDKHYNTSVWLGINKSPIKAGNACVIRRCSSTLTILGYENRDKRKTKTRIVHEEPIVLENDMKYMQVFWNQSVPIPQSEWYATAQLNYFTDSVKINDRFIFGAMDKEVRENNSVYKVKAVIKVNYNSTFVRDENSIEKIPLVVFALDKDEIHPKDNFQTRIANNAPVFNIPVENKATFNIEVEEQTPGEEPKVVQKSYTLEDSEEVNETILLNHSQNYKLALLCDNETVTDADFTFTCTLEGKKESMWSKYFTFEKISGTEFKIVNLKTWQGGPLKVVAAYTIPDNGETLSRNYYITLGKSY